VQRTNLPWAWGSLWKCRPRIRALPDAQGFIVLHEGKIVAMLCEKIRSKRLCKIAPLITNMPRHEQLDTRDIKGLNFHGVTFWGQPRPNPEHIRNNH
jgi:hypothetical protein